MSNHPNHLFIFADKNGQIDGVTLTPGETVTRPASEDHSDLRFSVSKSPETAKISAWPGRLFKVEAQGTPQVDVLDIQEYTSLRPAAAPNVVAPAIKVIEEVTPAHAVLGPKGAQVEAFLASLPLTPDALPAFNAVLAEYHQLDSPSRLAWAAARHSLVSQKVLPENEALKTAGMRGVVALMRVLESKSDLVVQPVAPVVTGVLALCLRDVLTEEDFDALMLPLVKAGVVVPE